MQEDCENINRRTAEEKSVGIASTGNLAIVIPVLQNRVSMCLPKLLCVALGVKAD